MSDTNKALMRQYHDAWSRGALDELKQLLAEDCVNYQLVTGEKRGVDFELEACRLWHASFSDVRVHIEQMVAEADRVTVYWTLYSIHTSDFIGIPATGNELRIPGMEINRIVDGKIVEIWRLSDEMSTMRQLGQF